MPKNPFGPDGIFGFAALERTHLAKSVLGIDDIREWVKTASHQQLADLLVQQYEKDELSLEVVVNKINSGTVQLKGNLLRGEKIVCEGEEFSLNVGDTYRIRNKMRFDLISGN